MTNSIYHMADCSNPLVHSSFKKIMKVIYNSIIPFKGFSAINLFGVLFVRKEYKPIKYRTINHEQIHTAQMKELGYIFFYIIYLLEWIYGLIKYRSANKAYYYISFEREAYEYEKNFVYLTYREKYAWFTFYKDFRKYKNRVG